MFVVDLDSWIDNIKSQWIISTLFKIVGWSWLVSSNFMVLVAMKIMHWQHPFVMSV
jgi:hypothetical protein